MLDRQTRPAARALATGCLVLALALAAATCRLDKLVKPQIHDRLLVSPAALLDSAHAGSSVAVTSTLRLVSADGATLRWTAVVAAPWLQLSAPSGGAPDSVRVTLDPDTLSQAIRRDTIVFVSPEAPGDTVRVPVTFNVLAPAPELTLSPSAYVDSAFAGSLQARTFVLHVDNTGGLPLSWSAAVDSTWLTLSADTGSAPPGDSIVVALAAGTRAAGTRSGAVTVSAPGALGAPATVAVTFKIKPCDLVAVTPDALIAARIGLDDCGAPDRAGSVAKRYSVAATVGDTISIRLASAAFDTYLTLQDSLGSALTANDDCASQVGASCILEFAAPAAGRYVVEATTALAADTGAFTLSVVRERAPSPPQSIAQLRADSSSAIGLGQVTTDSATVFRAALSDPNPRDSVRLEVEAVPTASPFSGTATHQSGYVGPGQTAWIRAAGLNENTAYHWRARNCDTTSRCSAWQSFGGNADGSADFIVNAVPETPAIDALSLNQFNGAAAIPVGGGTGGGLGSTQTVTFKGTVTDVDPGDVLVIEVEAKATGTAFDGTGVSRGTGVASGATASVAVAYTVGLLGANYHWRARACDQTSRCSAWSSFGGNPEANADFHVP